MNFNDMHALSKRIDTHVKSLQAKVPHPMTMMYSNNSSRGVKVLSMLTDMIKDVENKKQEIENLIREENSTWSEMVEDYNSVAKFKSEVVANLNDYENMWSSNYPDYKPFISYSDYDSVNEELNSLNDVHIHDDRQIADQSLNDSLNNVNITMS
uniref:ACYPI22671 protein n=1 Tax=Acyrthosiphon pisum TaxID=7029 RepID=C4WW13_ACYPI|nr:ACYPI22671 [Acyrthosiphon pisum]